MEETNTEQKELTLKEKVDLVFAQLNQNNPETKRKQIKLMRKARAKKRKIKKGWVGVLKIDENGNISGERQKIEGSTLTLKDGTYHATNGSEVLFWDGKYPVLVQETKSRNPIKFNGGDNQTYGQKYIMARMLKDAILMKKKGGNLIVVIIVIAIIGYIAFSYFG